MPKINGTLKDYTWLGGCGWVIELDVKDKNNNNKIEPTNLNKFKINFVNGQKVKFSYIEKIGGVSSCMVGIVAEIKSIKNN